jgi:MAF protein
VNEENVLVLASNSPRRRQLLALGNLNFIVNVADIDETQLAGETPKEYVLRLAQEKALAVKDKVSVKSIVIGSDTTVVADNSILGKPVDAQEAEKMLKQLRGRTHQVYTGIALYRAQDGKMLTELSITDVPMRDYSDDEIRAYIETGDPMDKAGAYAIQHPDFQPVHSMQGCYAGVMGLSMCHVLRALQKFDISPAADVPAACQTLLNYQCQVSSAILRGESPSSPALPPTGREAKSPLPLGEG